MTRKLRLFALLCSLALSAGAQGIGASPFEVREVLVAGSFALGEARVLDLLGVGPGEAFESEAALEAALRRGRERLLAIREFMFVEVFTSFEAEGASVFVSLTEHIVVPLDTEFGTTSFFKNLPVRGVSLGLGSPPFPGFGLLGMTSLGERSRLVAGLAYLSYFDGNDMARSLAELHYSPAPELRLRLPLVYTRASESLGDERLDDLALGAALSVDYAYLKRLFGWGAKVDTAVSRGLAPYAYTTQSASLALYWAPSRHFELAARAVERSVYGDAPFYAASGYFVDASVRAPVDDAGLDHVFLVAAEARAREFFVITTPLIKAGVSALGFYETGFEHAFATDLPEPWRVAGGGLGFEIRPPISLFVRLEYGWNIDLGSGRLALFLGDYF